MYPGRSLESKLLVLLNMKGKHNTKFTQLKDTLAHCVVADDSRVSGSLAGALDASAASPRLHAMHVSVGYDRHQLPC